ncbi:MAG TPA: ABC transporter ATP-binding protein, partial [Victivallales bacterium]|nr:ABC transporter ATP-binding protein [Victivallales bacterium]
MKIEIETLSVSYDGPIVLNNINLSVKPSEIISIVGPNGSGKSTLLRSIAKLISPISGNIYVDNKNLKNYSRKELSLKIAFLPQYKSIPEDITVLELISYGRYPHQSNFITKSKYEDIEAIDRAIALTKLEKLQSRKISTLSGGEQQRTWIALCIAQETDILLLDEPTTFLDIKCQLDVMELIQQLNYELKTTIIMTLHDLNHATHYSNRIIALKNGEIFADATPENLINKNIIKAVFDIECKIISYNSTPFILPIRN